MKGNIEVKAWKSRTLPCEKCGGQCCFNAPIEASVWRTVSHKANGAEITILWEGTTKEAVIASKPGTEGECWFLVNGRCSIYSRRPKSCRAVGTLFPCAVIATEKEKEALTRRIEFLRNSGHKFNADERGEK